MQPHLIFVVHSMRSLKLHPQRQPIVTDRYWPSVWIRRNEYRKRGRARTGRCGSRIRFRFCRIRCSGFSVGTGRGMNTAQGPFMRPWWSIVLEESAGSTGEPNRSAMRRRCCGRWRRRRTCLELRGFPHPEKSPLSSPGAVSIFPALPVPAGELTVLRLVVVFRGFREQQPSSDFHPS